MHKQYEFKQLSSHKHIILNYKEINKSKIFRPAIFFDRDGVLIKDVHYISDPIDVELLPGVKEVLKKVSKYGWLIILVTNQSGISRGFSTWKDYEKVTIKMIEMIGEETFIDGIYANSYSPNALISKRNWRKPNPGMIFAAAKQFNINLRNSVLIGDRLTDLISARNAGINKLIHVLTGHGKNEHESIMKFFNDNNKDELLILQNLVEFKNYNFTRFIRKQYKI